MSGTWPWRSFRPRTPGSRSRVLTSRPSKPSLTSPWRDGTTLQTSRTISHCQTCLWIIPTLRNLFIIYIIRVWKFHVKISKTYLQLLLIITIKTFIFFFYILNYPLQKLIVLIVPDVCFQRRWIHSRRLSGNRCHANLSVGVRRLWFQVLIQCDTELDGRGKYSEKDTKLKFSFSLRSRVLQCYAFR